MSFKNDTAIFFMRVLRGVLFLIITKKNERVKFYLGDIKKVWDLFDRCVNTML